MNNTYNNGWTYEVFSKEEAANRSDAISGFTKICYAKSAEGDLPNWANFDFYDFIGYHGRILIADILEDPFDILYRLWGTELTEQYGRDYTNRTLSSMIMGHAHYELKHMQAVQASQMLGYSKGPVHWENKEYRIVEWLDIPFSSNNKKVDLVVSYMLSFR